MKYLFLIHGFMRTPRCMASASRWFKCRGYQVNLFGYSSKHGSVQHHAGALVHDMMSVMENDDSAEIYFLTHSFGGIVLLAALNQPHCPDRVKAGAAVLLGPPLRGSCLARKLGRYAFINHCLGNGIWRCLRECPPDGYEKEIGPFPVNFRLFIIAGDLGLNFLIPFPNDGKVSCEETRPLFHEHSYRQLHLGHSWMMYSRRAWQLALEFFSATVPQDSDGTS